jgi:hypothetical protein
MLFDLRGRGRRRTIQAIYLTLAVLMGGGLVFFGIGGNTSGGLFDAFKGGGGGGGGNDVSAKQAKKAERQLKLNPRDAAAWGTLAGARFQQAVQTQRPDQQSFTEDGKKKLEAAASAWEHYIELAPPKPDAVLATKMIQTFAPFGPVNRPASGVKAAQVLTVARPSSQTFYQLAVFAYVAKQTRQADLAAAEAIRRAPPAQREQVKAAIDQAKHPPRSAAGGAG